ncbi:MAG: tyrosine-type recombinase/integrase, partial [Cryomorphaceae bacterium]|nr:tyrosine-type recombinase/integrase [Cryomorphaceae bacterium]
FKIKKVQNIFYERDEVLNIIDACNQLSFPYKYVPQIQLLIVRRQETVINMEWNDILWKEKLFKSRMEIEKKEQSNLNVPLSDKALELLKEIKDYQKKNSINSKYIFPCPDDPEVPIHPRHQRRRFSRKIKALTGIKHYEATHLRHTSRTWMSRLKIRPEVVSFIGGWSKYGGADHNVHYNSDDYSLGGESHEAVNKLAGVFYSSDEVTVPAVQGKHLKSEERDYEHNRIENRMIKDGVIQQDRDGNLILNPEKVDIYKNEEELKRLTSFDISKETRDFLQLIYVYQWTRSKDDLQKLIKSKTPLVEKELTVNKYSQMILKKYYNVLEQSHSGKQRRSEVREILPQIMGIMLLREAIEEINVTGINPITTLSIEDIKEDYTHLQLELFEDVKRRMANKEYGDETYGDEFLESARRKVEQYEAKFKEIECELFYKCLVYKNTAFIKFIGKVDKATLINPKKFGFKEVVPEPKAQ